MYSVRARADAFAGGVLWQSRVAPPDKQNERRRQDVP
jgi:hypothetical protein